MSPRLLPDPPRNILLVRLSARGDMVFASPMVRVFRATYPDARITWLAESHTKNLIEHHPELDEVIVWDRAKWKKLGKERRFLTLFREVKEFITMLRGRKFDLAVDMQGLLRSGLMSFLSGAPTRIGLRPKEGSRFFHSHVVDADRNLGDRTKISSEYLYLAQLLRLDTSEFRMEVPLSPEDREFAREWLAEEGLESGYMVAIPFTTKPQKHWFEDRWADVLGRIPDEFGLKPVFLGAPGDQPALDRIKSMMPFDPLALVGKTSLTQAAAVIEGAALVIGVDTCLTHIGIAFDRPTVAIFGSNIPYTDPPTDRTRVLVNWQDCSPCKGNPICDGEFTCLKLTTQDGVLDTAREVIAAGERERTMRNMLAAPAQAGDGRGGGAEPDPEERKAST